MWYIASADLEQQINQLSIRTVLVSAIILVVCTAIAMLFKKYKPLKLPLFIIMASTMVISTVILFGSTIYLNTVSESKGPVHWHTDIEYWVCGSEIEFRDPTGFLSNKIGTSTFHEHNDKRMHLEGVVVKKSEDASLGKYMRVTGGYVNQDGIAIPINKDSHKWLVSGDDKDGDPQNEDISVIRRFVKESPDGLVLQVQNGDTCADQSAELQVFLYRYNKENDTYSQTKLDDPAAYVMRDESVVPPGDCVIVEFDVPKDRTDKLCEQYGVRDAQRCLEFGVKRFNPELCNIREVAAGGSE